MNSQERNEDAVEEGAVAAVLDGGFTKDLVVKVLPAGSLANQRLLGASPNSEIPSPDPELNPKQVSSRVLYDAMALSYNALGIGDLMLMTLPTNPQTGNPERIIKGRGLTEDDFSVFRPLRDEEGVKYKRGRRPYAIERKTGALMRSCKNYPAKAAALAQEAVQIGRDFDFIKQQRIESEARREELELLRQAQPPSEAQEPERKQELTQPLEEDSEAPLQPLQELKPMAGEVLRKPKAPKFEGEVGLLDIPSIAANT